MLNLLYNIVFVGYLKDKHIRRLCLLIGIWGPVFFFFGDSNPLLNDNPDLSHFSLTRELLTALAFLYTPFIVACIIKWVYLTFFTNTEK